MPRLLAVWTGIAALTTIAAGCGVSMNNVTGVARAYEAKNAPAGGGSSSLFLFGGQDHKTFLGCFCGQVAANSVFNSVSPYGSSVSATSIYNHVGQFGSRVSGESACNPVALDPPVVVNGAGQFVGRLTMNRAVPGAFTDQRVLGWLESVCSS